MQGFAIIFQILGFYSRRADANRWLRVPTQKRMEPSSTSDLQRIRYLRVDAVPNTISAQEQGWEEEIEGEVMMELDQLGQLFDEAEESIMDMFEIEQIDDPEEENEVSLLSE